MYLGIAIAITGFFLGNLWIFITGILIAIDDMYQHISKKRSPLKILYGYIYHKWEWVRDLNEWFDTFFGKKKDNAKNSSKEKNSKISKA